MEASDTREPSGRFRPGSSGNPHGRPCRAPLAERLDRLAEAAAEGVFKAVLTQAEGGDAACARLVLERAGLVRNQPNV